MMDDDLSFALSLSYKHLKPRRERDHVDEFGSCSLQIVFVDVTTGFFARLPVRKAVGIATAAAIQKASTPTWVRIMVEPNLKKRMQIDIPI